MSAADGWLEVQASGQTPWVPRRKHCSVAFEEEGLVFVIGGFEGKGDGMNDIWSYSVDEGVWNCVNEDAGWSGRDGHVAIVFNGSLFVIGGTNDPYSCKADVWKSEDGGVRWRELCSFAPWKERWQHAAVVHEDRICILGGWGGSFMNDVWSSSDGLHWIQETSSAEWQSRMFHCAVSIDDSIYIIGGSNGKTLMNDVWASSDRGKSWTQVCENAPWGGRQGHTCVVVDKNVYLMAGMVEGEHRKNDVWRSKDGCVTWTQVHESAGWGPRQGHACAVCDGAIYLSGGWNDGYLNDCFSLRVKDSARGASSSSDVASTKQVASIGGGASVVTGNPVELNMTAGLAVAMECVARWDHLCRSRGAMISVMNSVEACVKEGVSSAPAMSTDFGRGTDTREDGSSNGIDGDSLVETKFSEIYSAILEEFHVLQAPIAGAQAETETEATKGRRSSSDGGVGVEGDLSRLPPPTESPLDLNYSVLRSAELMQEQRTGPLANGMMSQDPRGIFFSNFRVDSEYGVDHVLQRLRSMASANGAGTDTGTGSGGCSNLDAYAEHTFRRSRSTSGLRGDSSLEEDGPSFAVTAALADAPTGVGLSPGGVTPGPGMALDLRAEMSKDMFRIRRIQKAIRMRAESVLGNAAEYGDIDAGGDAGGDAGAGAGGDVDDARRASIIEMPEREGIQSLMEKRAKVAQKAFWRAVAILRNALVQKQMKVDRQARLQGAKDRLMALQAAWQACDYAGEDKEFDTIDNAAGAGAGAGAADSSSTHGDSESAVIMGVSGLDWLSEWEHASAQVALMKTGGAAAGSDSVERVVVGLQREVEELGGLFVGLSSWMARVPLSPHTHTPAQAEVEVEGGERERASLPPMPSPSALKEAEERLRGRLDTALKEMGQGIDSLHDSLLSVRPLAEALFSAGKGYLESVAETTQFDLTKFEDMEVEARRWLRVCIVLAHVPSLMERCNALVDMTAQKEDELVVLETVPIDKRATLSKATLEMRSFSRGGQSRRRFRGNSSGGKRGALGGGNSVTTSVADEGTLSPVGSHGASLSPVNSADSSFSSSAPPGSSYGVATLNSPSSMDDGYLQSLQLDLTAAENDAKLARKQMRAWNRDSRKVALEYAPEMFLLLPDLLSPGSVLGDGGFGELAGIPMKRFQDYDIDYTTPVNPAKQHTAGDDAEEMQGKEAAEVDSSSPVDGKGSEGAGARATSLYRAMYDGQQVVLKMYLMHDDEQRRRLERELSILGRLKNDAIVAPTAIVDGCTYEEDIKESLRKMAIYVEYPCFSGGDLSQWLVAKGPERKPWELQGVARQLLYGLLYLHDHGVIHGRIDLSSIMMHRDGRLVITAFDHAVQIVPAESKKTVDGVEAQLRVSLSQSFPALQATAQTQTGDGRGGGGGGGGGGNDVDVSSAGDGRDKGNKGFKAPELERGEAARYESDMYSFGVLLYVMHFPRDPSQLTPGEPLLPESADPELASLIRKLMSIEPSSRPSAAQALLHPYFRRSFAERLQAEGEVVEQDRKLDAVRNMLQRAREENRTNLERISISRERCAEEVLAYFKAMNLNHMRYSLRVTFDGEAGVDEGGPLTEMFHLFFDQVLDPSFGLFHGCDGGGGGGGAAGDFVAASKADKDTDVGAGLEPWSSTNGSGSGSGSGGGGGDIGAPLAASSGDVLDAELKASGVEMDAASAGLSSVSFDQDGEVKHVARVVLPAPADLSMERLHSLRAFGRAMIKAMYEGRRMGTKLGSAAFKFLTDAAPTMRDLQQFDPQAARSCEWALATEGMQNFGLHFESVDAPELGDVTDQNKVDFVKRKVHLTLVECRKVHLAAIKNGFVEGLKALSPEAAPFMGLLSHTDWRIMLCGDQTVSGPQVVSCLRFTDFHKRSQMPVWIREILLSASEDHLRKFLVFLTGSPSLSSSTSSGAKMEISVRCQPRSEALPIAHTCFFQLDIPDYKDKETLQAKFVYAITHAQSFEVV